MNGKVNANERPSPCSYLIPIIDTTMLSIDESILLVLHEAISLCSRMEREVFPDCFDIH